MKKVLAGIPNFLEQCPEASELLRENGFEIIDIQSEPIIPFDKLEDVLPELDAVMIGGNGSWDKHILEKASKLKVISKTGSGTDNIDLATAKQRGIRVTNTKGSNTNAVAELTIGLMITMLRHVPIFNQQMFEGEWNRTMMGSELKGKTIGLIGFGQISQKIASLLSVFETNILAYDVFPNHLRAEELGVTFVELDHLLGNSDIISLHTPYMKETHHLIGDKQFALLKEGASVINAARGSLVDEKALYRALCSQKVASAALDVFEEEPVNPQNPLLKLDNVICMPHIGGTTCESLQYESLTIAKAIIDVLNGREPQNIVV
ncbi:phosphoglycerate dehydrogenase [Cohnella faecalis]|uniref:Phosphoglycerate dehydrogenase n=1 Tax=Cohnella faecalis TaxID=2315694 RepID=A0A398CGF2_9BACL|nr:phosphoglycerate dehydrogenase [Cohnella faecalis]RIE01570.1 phosphoglycerate dehydrogenase [Cohnella faecalis]